MRLTKRATPASPAPAAEPRGASAVDLLRDVAGSVGGRRVLVLCDEGLRDDAEGIDERVVAVVLGEPVPEPGSRFAMVVLLAHDVASLRRAASLAPRVRSTKVAAWWVAEADRPVLPAVRPEWPDVHEVAGRLTSEGSAVGWVRFAGRGPGVQVLQQVARDAVPAALLGGLVVAATPSGTGAVLPADPGTILVDEPGEAADEERDVPPDVVLHSGEGEVQRHHVLARGPVLVQPPPLPPLDEGVLNPVGFLRSSAPGTPVLRAAGDGIRLEDGPDLTLDRRGPTRAQVARLRTVRGVTLAWEGADPRAMAHLAAGWAMAGVPLVGAPQDAATRALLGDELSRLLGDSPDLADELRREEHSIRLRRAALERHSSRAWRSELAQRAGSRWQPRPSVSVVLSSRRPERQDFALRQLAKQRVDAELVFAGHGFRPDAALASELLRDRPFTLLERPDDEPFGDVLHAAVQASSGEVVVKMDDDDWYGPDFLRDLLLARAYSGADVTGVASEFLYLQPSATTIRRGDPTELPVRRVLAGGSLTLGRELLSAIGGFRSVHRYVDASLLSAARAVGATVYRSHGLNYCYRRTGGGHTWDPGIDYFHDEDRISDSWSGFRPSELLEHDADELP